jgi:hypothetical protein
LPFPIAKANFYKAARDGLVAEVEWLDGGRLTLGNVLEKDVLPRARTGLLNMGIDTSDADLWLGIIEGRVGSGQNGSAWQRAWVQRHGPDLAALTAAYLEAQQSGRPVHQWTL